MSMLEVSNLEVVYNDVVLVLRGISLEVEEGQIVALLGANGAGKTTTLRAISGLLDVHNGDVTKGGVTYGGDAIEQRDAAEIVKLGIVQVLEGRRIFAELSVEDNLRVGAFTRRDREVAADMGQWYETYPVLAERRDQLAGSLSGGEQQMLAVARALMSRPELPLLDEPPPGLAPLIAQDPFAPPERINAQTGTTILLVEQKAQLALDLAERAYVLEAGTLALSGPAHELRENDAIRKAYLGY